MSCVRSDRLHSGYTELATESKVRGIVVDGMLSEAAEEGDLVEVVLERTPFYAESGGQILTPADHRRWCGARGRGCPAS